MSEGRQSAVIERSGVEAKIQEVFVLTSALSGGILRNGRKRRITVEPKVFAQIATVIDSRSEGLLLHKQTLATRYPEFTEQLTRLAGSLSEFILLIEIVEMASSSMSVVLLRDTVQKEDREELVKRGVIAAKKMISLSLEASVRLEAWEWHPIPSFTTNLEGRLLSFNKALRSLFGAKKAFSIQHLFGPDFVAILQKRWVDLQRSKHLEFVFQPRAGKKATQVITVNAALVGDTVIVSTQLSVKPKASISMSRVHDIKRKQGLLWLLRRDRTPVLLGQKAEITIGRDPGCDISIPEDNHSSRIHARLVVLGDRVKIEDLGSNNGTYINGKRISRHVLRPGDKIRIGRTEFLIRGVENTRSPTTKDKDLCAAETMVSAPPKRKAPAAPKAATTRVVTQGDIASKALVHIFQGIGSYARTCTMRVTWKSFHGEISFVDGIPHTAKIGKLTDLNAAIFLLNIKEGRYVLTDKKPQSRRTMFCTMMKLYMTRIPQADLEKLLGDPES